MSDVCRAESQEPTSVTNTKLESPTSVMSMMGQESTATATTTGHWAPRPIQALPALTYADMAVLLEYYCNPIVILLEYYSYCNPYNIMLLGSYVQIGL